MGTSGWYYNNVGAGGVNGSNPHDGNGSVSFRGSSTNSKADIEYLGASLIRNFAGNYAPATPFGPFFSFVGMSYDWYRSSSTADAILHLSLRVLLDLDGDLSTTNDRGGLVLGNAYNGGGAVATNQWVFSTIDAATNLRNFGLGLGYRRNINSPPYAFDATLAEWQAFAPRAVIIGFSGGSGWGRFSGAADNVTWTVGNVTLTSNFELKAAANPMPEPGSLALFGLGLVGLLAASRRRKPS